MGFIEFLEKLGGKTLEVTEVPLRRIPEGKSIQERLKALREIQREIEEEKRQVKETERIEEEIVQWRKEEVAQPFSERLAETMLKYFRGPIEALANFFSGLDVDLYRANIMMSPTKYVAYMVGVALFISIFGFLMAYLFYQPLSISLLAGLLGFIGGLFYMRYYPKLVWRKRVSEVEKALPYVLRHVASLLSAGVGIVEALLSVAKADYGPISEEFELVIRDMRTGSSFEEAMTKFEEKMASENVSRVVKQILRAVKFGGNLADVLYKLAEDFSFEYRMKLVEYVQKVNGVSFIYMFMTIVMPTMFVIGILAASVMAKTLVLTVPAMAVILLLAFPLMSFIIINMIRSAEPR